MRYEPKNCTTCGVVTDYINHKCDKCKGVRSEQELSTLSVEEQIKLRFYFQKEITRLESEWSNLRRQCTHSCLTKKHLRFDRWMFEVVDDNIHSDQEESFVWCAVCGKEFGWDCPKNPKGYCEYPSNFNEEAVYGCSILTCVHCRKPKNRFYDKEYVKERVCYERQPDDIGIPEVDLVITSAPMAAGARQLTGFEAQRALTNQKDENV